MLGSKISVCPPQAKKNLLSGSKIVIFVQFGASERGVSPRNQVLARLVLTPGVLSLTSLCQHLPLSQLLCSNAGSMTLRDTRGKLAFFFYVWLFLEDWTSTTFATVSDANIEQG